jgi:acetyl-CoA carboxylase beta subunit
MPCSNDQCEEIISRRDKEIHENKVCDFRRVKCDYCAQMVLYKDFMRHVCPPRQEIREMKAELRAVRSTQDEMFKMMQNMMSSLTRLERNMAQRSEGSHASSGQELQAEIVVAGGFGHRVETYRDVTDRCKHCERLRYHVPTFFQATRRKMINCACSASLK